MDESQLLDKVFQGFLLVGFFLGGYSLNAQSKAYIELEKAIDNYEATYTVFDKERTPGYLIAVIKNDSTYFFSRGTAVKGDRVQLTTDDVFETGGLSMVITAMIAHELVARGLLNIDVPIENYIHYLPKGMPTLHQLLHHTSGLPKIPNNRSELVEQEGQPYSSYAKEDLLQFLYSWSEEIHPTRYQYSFINYALIEWVLESASGKDLQTLFEEFLGEPLGLASSFFGEKSGQKMAAGYTLGGQLAEPWQFETFMGALGFRTSMNDLLTLSKAILKSEAVLSFPFREMWRSPIPTGIEKKAFVVSGWHVLKPTKRTDVLVHTGTTAGARAYWAFVPATSTCIIALSNAPYGLHDLDFRLLSGLNRNWKK